MCAWSTSCDDENEEGKHSSSLPALTDVEKLPYSAAHTLKFIQKQYVDADDDAPHTTWDRILKATREPNTSRSLRIGRFVHGTYLKARGEHRKTPHQEEKDKDQ